MIELLEDYFRRDLSEAEDSTLQTLLESSPKAAQEFADLAAKAYLATGWPHPFSGLPLKRRFGRRARRWYFAAGGLALAALGTWFFWREAAVEPVQTYLNSDIEDFKIMPPSVRAKETQAPTPVPIMERTEVRNKPKDQFHKVAPPATQIPSSRYSRMAAVVRLARVSLVSVRVTDLTGRPLRRLFQGQAAAGMQRYEWDGRLENGERATLGEYLLEVSVNGRIMKKKVRLLATDRE